MYFSLEGGRQKGNCMCISIYLLRYNTGVDVVFPPLLSALMLFMKDYNMNPAVCVLFLFLCSVMKHPRIGPEVLIISYPEQS